MHVKCYGRGKLSWGGEKVKLGGMSLNFNNATNLHHDEGQLR